MVGCTSLPDCYSPIMAESAAWKRYREWAGREALRQQTIREQRDALERAAKERAAARHHYIQPLDECYTESESYN